MTEFEPEATHRGLSLGVVAELDAMGFDDPQEVGRGGFGVVYRCREIALDRDVAVKILTADLDDDNLERFLREQRAMGRLSSHPNIVAILQAGVTDTGRPYIVMPFHERDSLDARLRADGPIPPDDAVRIGVKVAGALETAHRAGTLHRDVKPGNILVSDYGEPELTDFGIARTSDGFRTGRGLVTGSPAYTAPEVLRGDDATVRSDVYSLGATLFSLVTGHAAFERRSGEKLVAQFVRITTEAVPDLRSLSVPDPIASVVERAMAHDPADRYPSAGEVGDALRDAQRGSGDIPDDMAVPQVVPVRVHPLARHRTVARDATVPPPSAATKYRPPTPNRSLVARDRLLDTIRAGGRRLLTVIHGPAGFGKSTLAAQWRDDLSDRGVAAAWMSIDDDDNNVVWFLTHLIEAVRTVRPTLAGDLVAVLEQDGAGAERYVLTTLIDQIHNAGTQLVLVLDDWHRVTDPATIDALAYLLDHGCHHLQLVVTSRSRAGLPMSRLRVRDELVEIDTVALRFDSDEARVFLDHAGLDLDEEDVAELGRTTDGWAAALQLASVSLRDADDPAELIGRMSGRHHAIGDYLAENVLDALDPAVLDFLVATSITERTCGSLATALTGVRNGQAMLERVEDGDLFLRRLDDEREWFHYHTVFSEFLRRRLSRDDPERIPRLHAAASRWFAAHGLVSEAVDHAIAAGDDATAGELVEKYGVRLLEQSQMSTLLALARKLPRAIVESSTRIQLMIAWACVLLQRTDYARVTLDLFDAAAAHHDDDPAASVATTDQRVEADVIRATALVSRDRVDGVDDLVLEPLRRPETLRPWVVSAAANVATFLDIYRFDFAGALRRQEWARTYHDQSSGPFTLVYGLCLAGIAANELLDLDSAERHLRRAVRTARRAGGSHTHAARLASALLGELVYERGDLDEAERLIDVSYELGSEGGIVDFMLARYVIGARIKIVRGDPHAALRYLDDGLTTARTLAVPRLRARVENERSRLGLPPRRPSTDPEPAAPSGGLGEIVAQLDEATRVRTLAADDPDEAVRIARARVERVRSQGRPRALLQAQRLLVPCLAAAGDTDGALATLTTLTTQCARLSMVRYLADGGPTVVDLLRTLLDRVRARSADAPDVPEDFLVRVTTLEGHPNVR